MAGEHKDGVAELPKVILTEAQWEILQLFEADRTRAALEVSETQKQLLAQAAITLQLQAELMAQQEARFMSEKRDWFAGQASQVDIEYHKHAKRTPAGWVLDGAASAEVARYRFADAMMAARAAQP